MHIVVYNTFIFILKIYIYLKYNNLRIGITLLWTKKRFCNLRIFISYIFYMINEVHR